MILNIFPLYPGLSCKKNAPAPLLAKCNQIVTTNNIGDMQIKAMSEIQKSKNHLKKCLYILRYVDYADIISQIVFGYTDDA